MLRRIKLLAIPFVAVLSLTLLSSHALSQDYQLFSQKLILIAQTSSSEKFNKTHQYLKEIKIKLNGLQNVTNKFRDTETFKFFERYQNIEKYHGMNFRDFNKSESRELYRESLTQVKSVEVSFLNLVENLPSEARANPKIQQINQKIKSLYIEAFSILKPLESGDFKEAQQKLLEYGYASKNRDKEDLKKLVDGLDGSRTLLATKNLLDRVTQDTTISLYNLEKLILEKPAPLFPKIWLQLMYVGLILIVGTIIVYLIYFKKYKIIPQLLKKKSVSSPASPPDNTTLQRENQQLLARIHTLTSERSQFRDELADKEKQIKQLSSEDTNLIRQHFQELQERYHQLRQEKEDLSKQQGTVAQEKEILQQNIQDLQQRNQEIEGELTQVKNNLDNNNQINQAWLSWSLGDNSCSSTKSTLIALSENC